MTLEEYRRFYAEEIQFSANVSTTSLIEAFARVPREAFFLAPARGRSLRSIWGGIDFTSDTAVRAYGSSN